MQGWEPFDIREATLALYCVSADATVPFAPYASCNTRAAGEPPSCACENYADRQIGHCSAATVARDCKSTPDHDSESSVDVISTYGHHGEFSPLSRFDNKCTCSNASISLSERYVGAQPVYWPWPGGANIYSKCALVLALQIGHADWLLLTWIALFWIALRLQLGDGHQRERQATLLTSHVECGTASRQVLSAATDLLTEFNTPVASRIEEVFPRAQ